MKRKRGWGKGNEDVKQRKQGTGKWDFDCRGDGQSKEAASQKVEY